ncbi:hypothetical protein K488DRAFT_74655 [Vararia minispora EC-137]|uniref:Uncharacterized protein n=1 Tax=Vararia minispora EC-137 TaxID=1314806 RepID=A0ACB8Q688_9AGAM|nr:hypothetical protein K488DRAFT_74655 [Vararia minispora EC-137]
MSRVHWPSASKVRRASGMRGHAQIRLQGVSGGSKTQPGGPPGCEVCQAAERARVSYQVAACMQMPVDEERNVAKAVICELLLVCDCTLPWEMSTLVTSGRYRFHRTVPLPPSRPAYTQNRLKPCTWGTSQAYNINIRHDCLETHLETTTACTADVLEQHNSPRMHQFEPHPLLGEGHAGPMCSPNMALDEGDLRDCFKHVLTLCHAWDSHEWARRFWEQIETWVSDYAFNAHVIFMWEVEPKHTRGCRFSAEERYARFYACRCAMAGLTQECDLIVRKGAHMWQVATSGGHTVLDGREVDADAFRCTFGWWSMGEQLHFRSSQKTLLFWISEGIYERACQLGLEEPPRNRITQILQWMYPCPATAEDSIWLVHYGDSWEMVWGAYDFECDYTVSEDSSDSPINAGSVTAHQCSQCTRTNASAYPRAIIARSAVHFYCTTTQGAGQALRLQTRDCWRESTSWCSHSHCRGSIEISRCRTSPSANGTGNQGTAQSSTRPRAGGEEVEVDFVLNIRRVRIAEGGQDAEQELEPTTLPEDLESADGRSGLEDDKHVVCCDGHTEFERPDGHKLLSILALYLVFEHGKLARATGEGASCF